MKYTIEQALKDTHCWVTDECGKNAVEAIQSLINEVLDRVEEKATEYYDWSKSLEKEVERPFMAVPLGRIEKLRSEL